MGIIYDSRVRYDAFHIITRIFAVLCVMSLDFRNTITGSSDKIDSISVQKRKTDCIYIQHVRIWGMFENGYSDLSCHRFVSNTLS